MTYLDHPDFEAGEEFRVQIFEEKNARSFPHRPFHSGRLGPLPLLTLFFFLYQSGQIVGLRISK